MEIDHSAFKPMPKEVKPKPVRKVKPKISWDAFKAAPPKAAKKVKK